MSLLGVGGGVHTYCLYCHQWAGRVPAGQKQSMLTYVCHTARLCITDPYACCQAFEELECELNHEEGVKQQLCDELNQLVSTSVSSQLERFEQLKCKLESLQGGGGIGRTQSAPAKAAAAAAVAASGAAAHGQVISSSSELQQQVAVTADNAVPTAADALGQAASQQEREQEAADVAEAAAARSRHVQLPGHSRRQGHQSGRQGSAAGGAADVTATSKQQAGQQQERQGSRQAVQANGRFAGFDA